ncbi:H/ACA ribonucleoprotein complex subunit 1-like protein 1 [Hibiscus syriacus]|uniref:H/ACA ribonucleoprotein complex subunit 1-like protein 1 n=1 Tax=Hibiscus syriacus TaxID=106335 RepID=A0A6A2XNX5_HIBSY|nr:H/ACA ribonucleoprotein complex subunit 1-like protein 1 [Hibiscus syriacus]
MLGFQIKAIPVFLAQVSETKETGCVSGEYTISLYEVLARVHGVKIVPHIDSIMSTIIKTLASSAGSFPLQQACSKVVPAIARYGIDPTTPEDKKRHIIHSLCKPLSESLLGSQESSSTGAALCLKALVESDNWRFASDEMVNNVCQNVAAALEDKYIQTNAHMGLVMALAKHNALIVEAYARLLIKSGLRISNAGLAEGNSQKRFSAIQMINFLMKWLDPRSIHSEVELIIEEMEKCQSDQMAYVKGAAYEASQTAKKIAQEEGSKFENSCGSVTGSNFGRRDLSRRRNIGTTSDESPATASPESQTLDSFMEYDSLLESPISMNQISRNMEYDQRSVNRKLWRYENGGVDVSLKDGVLEMGYLEVPLPVLRSRSRINVDNLFTTPRRLIRSLQDPNDLNSDYEKQFRRFRNPCSENFGSSPTTNRNGYQCATINKAKSKARSYTDGENQGISESVSSTDDSPAELELDVQGPNVADPVNEKGSLEFRNEKVRSLYCACIELFQSLVISELETVLGRMLENRYPSAWTTLDDGRPLRKFCQVLSAECRSEKWAKNLYIPSICYGRTACQFCLGFIGSFPCLHEQRDALLEFKDLLVPDSTRDDNSKYLFLGGLETWNYSSECCQWALVECSSSSSSQQAIGEIPGIGLGNLSELVHLDMRGNSFNGSIPLQLFHLTNLEFLDLSGNMIEGGLPNDVVGLKRLKQLSLDANFIHGELPEEIGSLTELRKLTVSGNRISGRIPLLILQLAKLEVLILQNNTLSMEIPFDNGNLVNLTSLDLSKNLLTGEKSLRVEVAPWRRQINMEQHHTIEPMCKLSSLSLRSCSVRGEIPSWISNQTDLIFLDLSENDLEGDFPQWLAAERSLGTIILSDNKLSGSLPPQLFQSRNLSVLVLSRNKLSGELPEINTSSIMILMLSGNKFSVPVLKSISNIYRLLLMDLSNNSFSGNEFPAFGPNSLIAYVDVSSNNFSGKVPADFGLFTSMLSLSQNSFSGPLPENFSNLSMLEHLDLHDNNISGEFPAFFSLVFSLKLLNLRNNSIDGSISNDLSSLSGLRILNLSNNNLKGEIPQILGNLTGMIDTPDVPVTLSEIFNFPVEIHDLIVNWKKSKQGLSIRNNDINTFLDLSKNQLSGEIPHSLGGLKSLKLLNLSLNELSGKIPVSFGNLKSLETLDLSHNDLNGEIPGTFSELQQLGYLDLSKNELGGKIPEGPQMDRLVDLRIYANNSGLFGVQIRVPCEEDLVPPGSPFIKKQDTMFSWVATAIGYAIGFLFSTVVIYVIGYFNRAPSHHRRDRHTSLRK